MRKLVREGDRIRAKDWGPFLSKGEIYTVAADQKGESDSISVRLSPTFVVGGIPAWMFRHA